MFDKILSIREIAIIILAVPFFTWMMWQKKFRKNVLGLLISTLKLWKMLLGMIIYVIGSIYILNKFGLWNIILLKIALFWFFGWAFFMILDSTKIKKEKGYFKKTIIKIISFTVLVSFITNFYTFNIYVEVPLILFIATVSALSAFADIQKNAFVSKFSNGILVTFGSTVIIINLIKAMLNFHEFATFSTLREFLLPILLSLMFLPFLWGWSVYVEYESKKKMS